MTLLRLEQLRWGYRAPADEFGGDDGGAFAEGLLDDDTLPEDDTLLNDLPEDEGVDEDDETLEDDDGSAGEFDLKAWLKEQGVESEGDDEEAQLKWLVSKAKASATTTPAAPQPQQFPPQQHAPQQFQQPVPQQQQAAPQRPFYLPPHLRGTTVCHLMATKPPFDPAWDRHITQDANGTYKPNETCPPGMYEKFLDWADKQLRLSKIQRETPELYRDAEFAFSQTGQDQFHRDMEIDRKIQAIESRSQQQVEQAAFESMVLPHKDKLFLLNPDGSLQLVRGADGKTYPMLSELGQTWWSTMNELAAHGVQNSAFATQKALEMVLGRGQTTATPSPEKAATPAQKKTQLLKAMAEKSRSQGSGERPRKPRRRVQPGSMREPDFMEIYNELSARDGA